MISWRLWLGFVSGCYLLMGILSAFDVAETLNPAPVQWWGIVWIPASVAGLWHAATSRIPRAAAYSVILAMLASGSFARGAGLAAGEVWVGAIGWFVTTFLLVWGWRRAMGPNTRMQVASKVARDERWNG